MYIFSTKPSAHPTDQDTAHPDVPVLSVLPELLLGGKGHPRVVPFRGCAASRTCSNRGNGTVGESERERERRSERVSEREGGGECVCGVCVCVCACVCACVRACELCCSLILDRLAGHICICKQFSILVPVFVLPR